MSRSSSPFALSVVRITTPGDVAATAAEILSFDTAKFGFTHDATWAAMHSSLRGVLDPHSVAASLSGKHPRVAQCITGLVALGRSRPKNTRAFAHFPEAGVRPIREVDWSPSIKVRARATCWWVQEDGTPVIPILQPHKECPSFERLAVNVRISKQAFCRNEWVDAKIEIADLSGELADGGIGRFISEDQLPKVSDDLVASYIETYLEAKKLVDLMRPKPAKYKRDSGMDDLFHPRS